MRSYLCRRHKAKVKHKEVILNDGIGEVRFSSDNRNLKHLKLNFQVLKESEDCVEWLRIVMSTFEYVRSKITRIMRRLSLQQFSCGMV